MNRALVRKILYPAYRALKHDRVYAYLDDMRRIQSLDPEEIRAYNWKKLHTLLDYASRHVPYYRNMFARLGAAPGDIKTEKDLAGLPVLRKRDILADPTAFMAGGYPGHHLREDSTGGSTGEILYFSLGCEARQAASANNIRMNEWIGISVGDKIALLWGTPIGQGAKRRLVDGLRLMFLNHTILSAYKMGETSLQDYARRLTRIKPDLVIGYPSAMAYFAEAAEEAGMDLPRPRAVLLSGETLYRWQRKAIEKAFGVAAYNHYGCREFGAIARECKARQGLHIGWERLLVEAVPSDLAASGDDMGEIVITDLDNIGMPFIRYAIGDMGSITWDRCTCGLCLPRLKTTIGRTFDVVRAPNGNALGGTFWTILLRSRKGVERFQVIQEELDRITIVIAPTADFSDETRRYILDRVRKACGPTMRVRFELRPDLELTPTGKHRFVISKLRAREGGSTTADAA
jgi:phenylacetate-CoA ligase